MYERFLWACFGQNLLHLSEAVFLFLEIEIDTYFALSFFHTLFDITLNFHHTKTYCIPNRRKFNEDSTEVDHLDLATLERELQPRKPVHFYFAHPLCLRDLSNQRPLLEGKHCLILSGM